MSGRRPRTALVALALAAIVIGALAASAPASAATPAPAWSIRSLPAPAHFTPGDEDGRYQYEVRATNTGGAATDGSPITLTDTLPAGLTVKDVELPLRGPESAWESFSELCETEASGEVETVRCTVPEEVPAAVDPNLLAPAEQLRMIILVTAPAGAEGTTLTNIAKVEGGGAGSASTTSQNKASSEPAPAGFTDFGAALLGVDGLSARDAGSIPYQYVTSFAVNTRARFPSSPSASSESRLFDPAGGDVKDVRVALPPGMIGNPTAVTPCTPQQFNTSHAVEFDRTVIVQNDCPDGSAVGLVVVEQREGRGETLSLPLYNLVPPKGMPAQFGFQVLGAPFYIDTALRSGGDYGVTASVRNTTEVQRVSAATVIVWGAPSDPRHDSVRGHCLVNSTAERPFSMGTCPAGLVVEPFLRLPTSCEAPLATTMSFDTWSNRGVFMNETSSEPALINCAPLDFSPTISAVPHTTVADSPTGLRFNLHLPQSSDPDLLATADLRNAVVTLPEGVTVNPSQANGLEACSPAQIDLKGAAPANCPEASKIGAVEVHTPLLDHPVPGAVYVAAQNQNPFNSLLAIYIALHDPLSGVVVKLAGHVVPDPNTGRLTTTFADNPQLPFEDFRVEFFDGPRAALRTPGTCGRYATTTALRPWSAPESGPDAAPSDSFTVSAAPGGGPCAPSEAAQPHAPSFTAGTTIPLAASYSTLVTNLARADGSQTLRGLSVSLPEGLLAKLAGVAYCPEASLAAAAARAGRAELAAPSCPAASRIGSLDVGAGAGPSPLHVQGTAYLAPPYKGAPLSLAVITPAVAGPFDLGTVVVRAALRVHPETAEVTADSDPLPTILQGIPLDVRGISVSADRPGFTLNPTDCEPMAVGGAALSLAGHSAALSERFQVGGCRGLGFKPRLGLRLLGGTKRGAHPKLRAVLRARPGEANIGRAAVALPRSEFLDQSHFRTVCTRVQFAADACPQASIYGRAVAHTPLLDQPLRGPVYLRSSENLLPDLVVALRGPAHQPIEVDLVGRVDSVRGGIRNTFEAPPDAPVSKFVLTMQGGEKGLLINSTNLCRSKNRATVKMDGQNGKVHDFRPLVRAQCGKAKKRKQTRKRHGRSAAR